MLKIFMERIVNHRKIHYESKIHFNNIECGLQFVKEAFIIVYISDSFAFCHNGVDIFWCIDLETFYLGLCVSSTINIFNCPARNTTHNSFANLFYEKIEN